MHCVEAGIEEWKRNRVRGQSCRTHSQAIEKAIDIQTGQGESDSSVSNTIPPHPLPSSSPQARTNRRTGLAQPMAIPTNSNGDNLYDSPSASRTAEALRRTNAEVDASVLRRVVVCHYWIKVWSSSDYNLKSNLFAGQY
jgi:hypothetical protein